MPIPNILAYCLIPPSVCLANHDNMTTTLLYDLLSIFKAL
jgi:hypothetical protein